MRKVFITEKSEMPEGILLPDYLSETVLSQTAKLMYAELLSRAGKEGKKDENRHLYLEYTLDDMSLITGKSIATVKRVLEELSISGLIKRMAIGGGKPARTYVLIAKKNASPDGTRQPGLPGR